MPESYVIIYKAIVLIIYGGICIVSIALTFFINLFSRIDDLFNLFMWNSLEKDDSFYDWLIDFRWIVGPILIFISIYDIKVLFKLLDLL